MDSHSGQRPGAVFGRVCSPESTIAPPSTRHGNTRPDFPSLPLPMDAQRTRSKRGDRGIHDHRRTGRRYFTFAAAPSAGCGVHRDVVDHLGHRLLELARPGLAGELVADHAVLVDHVHLRVRRRSASRGRSAPLAVGPARPRHLLVVEDLASASSPSQFTPRMANGLPAMAWTSSRSSGYIFTQNGHQSAKKSTTTTLPR